MKIEFAQMFDGKELFVAPKAFRAWLAEAQVKAHALTSAEAVQAAMTAYAQRQVAPTMVGDVAVIDVCGPITYKSTWLSMYFGGASISDLQQQFRLAMQDPAVRSIVFRIDSPGGVVDMMPEFADEIFAARGQGKTLIGVADLMVASCAYWLGSQLDTLYATRSAHIGAIGVFCEHDDISGMLEKAGITITLIAHGEHKVDANPYQPLSDAARADLQASVDEVGGWFDAAVARGRGVKPAVVLDTFGQGKVFRGQKAKSLGMVDKIGTFADVLANLTKPRGRAAGARGSAAAAALAATDPALERAEADELQRIGEANAASEEAVILGKKKAKTAGCEICGKSSCPCMADDCPEDCPTCDPDCPCVQPVVDVDDDEAKARAQAIADEHEAIAAVIGSGR